MKKRTKTPELPKIRQFLRSDRFKMITTLFGFLLVVYVVIAFLFLASHSSAPSSKCVKTDADSSSRGRYHTSFSGTTCILWLEQADTEASREKGLSGRSNIPGTQGMLFTFEETGTHCMWMKDMYFAIDMLWLNEKRNIIQVEKNVKPDTYPKIFCGDNSRYVVEVKAGVSDLNWLQIGQRL